MRKTKEQETVFYKEGIRLGRFALIFCTNTGKDKKFDGYSWIVKSNKPAFLKRYPKLTLKKFTKLKVVGQ